jgi:uncharacterized protein
VRVLEVKLDKKQIALTMRSERGAERSAGAPARAERDERGAPRQPRPPGGRPGAGDRRPPPSKPAAPFNNPFAAALANKPPRR